MKIKLNVEVNKLEKCINRQIETTDSIELTGLIERILISFNCKKMVEYFIKYNGELLDSIELNNKLLKDLNLKKNDTIYINYSFNKTYCFIVKVLEIDKNAICEKDYFEILSGKGYGVSDDIDLYELLCAYNKEAYLCYKSALNLIEKPFDINEIKENINTFLEIKKESMENYIYTLNISLSGFKKYIKRKVKINNNINIGTLCRKVIVSMNGDLSHLYGIKINKGVLDEYYEELDFNYLYLGLKQRFKIIYDFGDNWEFDVSISKIEKGHNEIDFKVIDGKGYGIIDDCGGAWELGNIFDGENIEWGYYDINDFNIEKCNKKANNI